MPPLPLTPRAPGPNILLIGLRGSGKSTVARLLGARVNAPPGDVVDLDDCTPRELGESSVADAFARHGEAAFRAAEGRALSALLARGGGGQIIALGGGTPTAPGVDGLITGHRAAGRAVVFYLRADAVTLRARLSQTDNTHRPSLTGGHVLDEIGTLLAQRDPLYRTLADEIIEVGGETAEAIAAAIARRIDRHTAG